MRCTSQYMITMILEKYMIHPKYIDIFCVKRIFEPFFGKEPLKGRELFIKYLITFLMKIILSPVRKSIIKLQIESNNNII